MNIRNASGEFSKTEELVDGESISVQNKEEFLEELYDYNVSAISEAK